jgi:hypothetical protein
MRMPTMTTQKMLKKTSWRNLLEARDVYSNGKLEVREGVGGQLKDN